MYRFLLAQQQWGTKQRAFWVFSHLIWSDKGVLIYAGVWSIRHLPGPLYTLCTYSVQCSSVVVYVVYVDSVYRITGKQSLPFNSYLAACILCIKADRA